MKPLNEEEQKVLDNAPEWATLLLERVCDNDEQEYAIMMSGSFWDMQDVSKNNSYGNAFVATAWNVKYDLTDLHARKEQSEKKTVRDAVSYYHGDLEFYHEDGDHPIIGDGSIYKAEQVGYFMSNINEPDHVFVCTFDEFSKCTEEDTGPAAEFDAWSLELKFDRAREQYKHDEQDCVVDKSDLMLLGNCRCSMSKLDVGVADGENPIEWVNGDECIVENLRYELNPCMYIGKYTSELSSVVLMRNGGLDYFDTSALSKPETPEQKKLRELNIAKELQIEGYATKMWLVEGYKSDHIELLNRMQAEGMLAEIKLPE